MSAADSSYILGVVSGLMLAWLIWLAVIIRSKIHGDD